MVHQDGLQQVQQRLQTVKLGHLLLPELHVHGYMFSVLCVLIRGQIAHYWVALVTNNRGPGSNLCFDILSPVCHHRNITVATADSHCHNYTF